MALFWKSFFRVVLLAMILRPGAASAVDVLVRPGAVARGGAALVEFGAAPNQPALRAEFHDYPVLLLPHSSRIYGLIGVRLDSKPGFQPLRVWWSAGGLRRAATMLVQVIDRDYGVRRLTMETDTITLPEAEQKRVDKERAQVAQTLAQYTPEMYWRPPFVKPGGGIVTSGFGRRTFVNGKPRRQPHLGVDFRAGYGATVKAPAAGRVVLTGDHYLPGKSLYIDHGRGLFSAFYHLSEFKVRAGELVEKGRTVALAGNTGASTTGPHLHYGLYLNKTWINPLAFQEATEAIRPDFGPGN